MTHSSSRLARWLVGAGAIVLIAARATVADVLVHLDASVPDSLIEENGVITWFDESGNDRHATDDLMGGGISFPNATPFPSGLEGVDFDTAFGRQRMQLLDPIDAETLFNQSVDDAEGFSIFIVTQGEEPSPGGWNDIIGNSSVVSGGFLMRWNTDNGAFQASLDNGSVNPTLGGPNNYNNGDPFVIACNYDPITNGGELTLASTLNSYSRVFAVPPLDYSSGNPLWLAASTSGSRYFDGKIGEVLIYDTALTSTEFASKLAALGEKWLDLDREVRVRATVSAQLADGGDCDCSTVDVFVDDLLVGSMLPVGVDGVLEVPLPPESCVEEDGHVLEVICRNSFGDEGGRGTCTFSCSGEGTRFIRGDADSNGQLNITDPVKIFNFLFVGNEDLTCMDAADASDQGSVNLASGVYLLNHLFAASPEPPAPFPGCGEDTTEDQGGVDLGCELFAACP